MLGNVFEWFQQLFSGNLTFSSSSKNKKIIRRNYRNMSSKCESLERRRRTYPRLVGVAYGSLEEGMDSRPDRSKEYEWFLMSDSGEVQVVIWNRYTAMETVFVMRTS